MNEGVRVHLIVLICYIVLFYYTSNKFRRTGQVYVRPLEGVEKIKEGVGRAVEMGRPVHWSYGTGAFDAQHMAAFSLLSYTAKLCAEYDCRLIVSIALPELAPMTQEIINKAYSDAGKPNQYRTEDLKFWGGSHNAGMIGTIAREKVAANFMIGSLFYESVLGVEAAALNEAIQVGGTANTHQLPFIAAGCDSIFIRAEMFAASTQIEPTPVRVGCTTTEDWLTRVMLVLIVVGSIMVTFGNKSLINLLKL